VQRRRQKLIEEAPSPALDETTRREVGRLVTRALGAIGYESAGTVEFLRGPDGALHFMEMNTRLQVEHPVTEMIAGLDIVEHQLRIAAGEPLSLRQDDISWTGHAIEARINAEDPTRDFKPAPGRILAAEFPQGLGPGTVRVDTHLVPPCDVPPFYDSLVAKVIAHGADRRAALETLGRCLEAARVEGAPTTIPTHLSVLTDERFRRGDYDTGLLAGPPSAARRRET
jgi:acetyl-CoA carboxylase biotin carboxylase subunit